MLEGRRTLQWRRSTSTSLFRWAGAVILVTSIVMAFIYEDAGALIAGVPLFAATLFIEHLDRGYRISFDDEAIYMRPHGMAWNLGRRAELRIPFHEIAAVTGERSARSISYGNRFTPFEFAHVYRRNGDLGEQFALVGEELYDDDLREILHLLDRKAPGTLDQSVRDWLAGDQRF